MIREQRTCQQDPEERAPTDAVALHAPLDERLDPLVEVVIFRLVQESLTNIRKHARAQHAWITLEHQKDRLYLEVRDDGQGFVLDEQVPATRTADRSTSRRLSWTSRRGGPTRPERARA